jgi:hypothetical protein
MNSGQRSSILRTHGVASGALDHGWIQVEAVMSSSATPADTRRRVREGHERPKILIVDLHAADR